jgi:lysophospholipase L1-like esterase
MAKDVSIIVFGDSVAYGIGGTEKCGWVNGMRLVYERDAKDHGLFVYNLSIPGETTNDIMARLDVEVSARYDANKNNIIVFAIGLNDSSTYGTIQRVPYNIFALNIKRLIDTAKKYTQNVGFVGLTPVDERRISTASRRLTYTNNVIRKYDDCIAELAQKNDCQYTNIARILTPEDLVDGLHPNSVGHRKICQMIVSERKMH